MVLLVVLFSIFKKGLGKTVVAKVSVPVATEEPAPVPSEVKEADKEKEEPPSDEYTAEDKKDPLDLPQTFREMVSQLLTPKPESIVLPKLAISGVVWGSSSPQAIINGKILKKGDIIEEAEILEIGKQGVVVLYKGRQFTLPVSQPLVSKINQLE